MDERQHGRYCVACRSVGLVTPEDEPLEVDHRQPLSEGGDNNWTNLQWLCRSHNRAKGGRARLEEPFLSEPAWLRRQRRPKC